VALEAVADQLTDIQENGEVAAGDGLFTWK
jgi:hypothetical protein